MGKSKVLFRCGHKGLWELFGGKRQHLSQLRFVERMEDCPACFEAARALAQQQLLSKRGTPTTRTGGLGDA